MSESGRDPKRSRCPLGDDYRLLASPGRQEAFRMSFALSEAAKLGAGPRRVEIDTTRISESGLSKNS